MIRAIIGAALRFRLLVVAVAVGVLAVGIVQLRDAPVDVLPEFSPPYAEVQTEALGLSAEEVEQFVTVPLEADLLNGVEGVDVIRSQSLPSLSSITLVFRPGTDVYRARQLVQERLIQAHALPNVSKPPTLLQPLSSSSRLVMIALSSERLTPIEKSVIARWTIRPRLMGVPGVANVAIWGMRDQELQVQVDPERLRDRGVTLDQVVATSGNAQVVSPLSFLQASTPGTGGFIETPQQRMQVRNVLERIADPAELGKVTVDGTGGRLRLSDVADVRVDHQPLIGDAVVNDRDGLMLVVEKFPGANTLEVTRGVESALEQLRPGLAGMRADTSVFRPAGFIEGAIDNLTLAVIIAAGLLAIVLAGFLFSWRSLLICVVTIPLALIAAALVLDLLGETLNAISLAGLAIALAVVVDDAAVGAGAVGRRMRTRREGAVAADVSDASARVRSPLAYATLAVLLAIVPVVVMKGRPGAFFEPLALSYVLAVVAAMVVALTVTPALAALLFSRGAAGGKESPALAAAGPRYESGLGRVAGRPRAVVLGAAALVIVGIGAFALLDTALVPSFKDREVLVRLDGRPGTSQPRMTRIASQVSRDLRAVPGVSSVGAHVGRAVSGDQHVDVSSSEVWVSIDSGADLDATMASIEETVAGAPGVSHDVVTYTTQRIRDVGGLDEGRNDVRGNGLDVLTGTDRPLVARVYGQTQGILRAEADKVRQAMSEVDGVVDPSIRLPRTNPTLEIEVDLDRAQRYGIKPGDVRRAEATLLQGLQVGSVFQQQKVFDVVVQGVPATREGVGDVRNLLLDRPGGGHVRLGQVADVRVRPTPAVIEREAVSRYIDVVAGVSGRSLGAVAGDVRARLAALEFPLEYHAEVVEATTGSEIDSTRMLAFAAAAAIAVFLLLQAAFRSWGLAAIALVTLPVGLVGGVLAALVTGAELSLGAAGGLLALFGIAVRNAVLLIRALQDSESGARERLGPVLTTALGLAAVALPFVVMGARPGLEIVHPMAVVLLGGLVTTTLLALFVLPVLAAGAGAATTPPGVSAEDDLLHRWIEPEPAGAEQRGGAHAPAAGQRGAGE